MTEENKVQQDLTYVAPDVEEVISLDDLDQERLYAGGGAPPPPPPMTTPAGSGVTIA